MVNNHSRKRVPEEDEVMGVGIKCTADTLYSRGEKSRAMDASEYAIVFLDLGTKWREVHCSCERSESDARQAMINVAGPGGAIQSFYADGAKELVKAARDLDWCHTTSTPYRSNTNGRVERTIRTVEEGTRTILCEAGLPHKWWPYAARFFCWAQNILGLLHSDKSPYELRHACPFTGLRIAFGAAIHFRPNKLLAKKLPKCGPGGVPGIFIGWHVPPGGLWKR